MTGCTDRSPTAADAIEAEVQEVAICGGANAALRITLNRDVPHQKWMNFYTKVLSKFAATAGLKLRSRFETR